jgi:F420-dependent oxidoreductase-like protein
VLVGASGAGKSTWAATHFDADQIVSSDRLRAVVGHGEHDQRATKDAFELLELIVQKRLKRRLTTVVDSTALEPDRRARYVELGREARVPVHAFVFAVDEQTCRARNRQRHQPVPPKVITAQLRAVAEVQAVIDAEGFAGVHRPDAVQLVPPHFVDAPARAREQQEEPLSLTFGIHIGSFTHDGDRADTPARLRDVACAAERAGFTTLSLMDHFVQIPGVGREWEDMYESYTTLAWLAGATEAIRLGSLVTGVTYRNLAHLGKIVATLDVLSGGRAYCGLGAAWHQREHALYGWPFPPVNDRYALLQDALELLPLMWGKGAPPFEGRTTTVAEAICYPRPLQEHVPIWVGGNGERRTLKLAAHYADACNLLFCAPDEVRHKVDVLRKHCAAVGRDPGDVAVTHLSLAGVLEPARGRFMPDVGTVDELVGRYRALAEAGVQHAVVGVVGSLQPEDVERFAPVIAAFR